MRLLLIEDDAMLGAAMCAGLRQDGHAVDWVRTRAEAELAWVAPSPELLVYDAVVLDLGLPDGAGLDVLRAARAHSHRTPVLIATARDRVSERVAGLDAGADDYMVKPVDLDELNARLRALDRRRLGQTPVVELANEVSVQVSTRQVLRHGKVVDLTAREYAVLAVLARRPGVYFSRTQLNEAMYDWDHTLESNAIDVFIHQLRKKLGNELIQTARGLGYRVVSAKGAA